MQELIVAVAVAGAAAFLLKRYVPRALSGAVLRSAVRLASRSGHANLADRLERASTNLQRASACGGCSGCGSKDKPDSQGRHGISVEALRRSAKR
ncbi:DUF6587 family protein [Noviherbaspirillum denitrificans]|uniref:Uncharacterized protein n=1 Tax=Noviherbaspirillum denitrificans TaxID=1968433 RepID=A0A254THV3_9BURK|nr:DUF6587 family protein [Noviherbaspirillum denitrificans]OWW21767.1 hypothetical protein AYR66_22005 [Noviherbaspirillum denitrificans]